MLQNKHGFKGVRKRCDGRDKPYYARLTIREQFVYTKSFSTAGEAAKAFDKVKAERDAARRKQETDDEQGAVVETEQSGADSLREGAGEIHGEQLANDRHDVETGLSGNGLAPC